MVLFSILTDAADATAPRFGDLKFTAMWTSGVLYEWWGFLGQPLVKVEGVRGAIHCSLAMCLY